MSEPVHLLTGKGESFANPDGSSRQLGLARCQPGEPIALVREPANPRDPLAVALVTCRGVQVGYLSRRDARWLAPQLGAGLASDATVATVQCRTRPGSPLIVTVRVAVGACDAG